MMITEARKLGANEGGVQWNEIWSVVAWLFAKVVFIFASNNAVPLLEGALLKVI